MSRTLGQRIIIENIAGAGGTTGSTRAMRANPDGYTIEMGQMGTHATAVALYPNLTYRPEVDFDPIGMVSEMPQMLVARKDFAPKDLKEFIAFIKTNSEKINVGHAGVGSIFFSTCLLLHSILNVKPTLVPFNGGAPAMNALVAGQIDYMCADIVTAAPQLQASTIKGYAIASTSRNPAIPTVPTSNEAGLPAFQVTGWFALFAPKGTPKPIVDRLSEVLDRALDDEGTRKRLIELGNDIPEKSRRGQQALRVLLKDEIARWTPIIQAANVKAE
jgi:putative tricarboxylic transport membrane protein